VHTGCLNVGKYLCICPDWYISGAVLEGFLRFPETTQDFPSTMAFRLQHFTRHTQQAE